MQGSEELLCHQIAAIDESDPPCRWWMSVPRDGCGKGAAAQSCSSLVRVNGEIGDGVAAAVDTPGAADQTDRLLAGGLHDELHPGGVGENELEPLVVEWS